MNTADNAPETATTTTEKVETPEDKALNDAITGKLGALVSGPLTPRTLLMIENISRLSRELICVGKDSKALQRKSSYYGTPSYSDYDDEPLAPAPKAETFGAQLIREVVAMKNTAPPMTPVEMIGAIALAKEKGLEDIALKLEEKLLATPQTVEPAKEEPKALPAAPAHNHAH